MSLPTSKLFAQDPISVHFVGATSTRIVTVGKVGGLLSDMCSLGHVDSVMSQSCLSQVTVLSQLCLSHASVCLSHVSVMSQSCLSHVSVKSQ